MSSERYMRDSCLGLCGNWSGPERDGCRSYRVIRVDLREVDTQRDFSHDLGKTVYTQWLVLVPNII